MTATEAAPAKLPLAVRKSIRDGFDSYVPKFAEESKRLLGVEWTMEIDWARLLEEAGTERMHFTENPGEAMASWMKDALDQIKYQTKDGSDEMLVEGINEAAPSHIMSCKTDDSISGTYGCELSDGKLYLVFKSAKAAPGYFGSNAHKTLEDLQSKL